MNDKILISVAICTHNRADYLGKALNSLENQTLGQNLFEVIIIDNASSDKTAEVAKSGLVKFKNSAYYYEQTLGIARSRNRAFSEAKANYIAFLDDDAIAAPNWLEEIIKTFQASTNEIYCLGGKVEPLWEEPRPAWLNDHLLPFVSVLDISKEQRSITEKEYLVGANIAFDKKQVSEISNFPEDLGRKGNNLLSHEETELIRRIQKTNSSSVVYSPKIVVSHHVHKQRISKKWFLRRLFWHGISNGIQEQNQKRSKLNQLTSYIKLLFRTVQKAVYLIPSLKKDSFFYSACLLSSNIGRLCAPSYIIFSKMSLFKGR